jgi:hypothetical protein
MSQLSFAKERLAILNVEHDKIVALNFAISHEKRELEKEIGEETLRERFDDLGGMENAMFELSDGNRYVVKHDFLYRVKGIRKQTISNIHSGMASIRHSDIINFIGYVKTEITIV